MNRTVISGNIVRDPESRDTTGGTKAEFTLAVRRAFKDSKTGQYETDFFSCIAWRNTADYVLKYAHKGSRAVVSGRMQSRKYTARDGSGKTVWECIADEVDLIRTDAPAASQGGFEEVDDDELPFLR